MQMEKTFNPTAVEDRLYKMWEESGAFIPERVPGKKPFTVMMPPPNITGHLHMGHAMDEIPTDILIRYHRMKGDPTLWLPGTDHASIATEVKIVDAMKEEGLTKQDLGREEFLKRAWQWREQYGRRIVSQQRKLGTSCDWTRERFTMDEGLNKAVIEVFVRLYEKGLIYRGARIINWCPECQSALSDAEVEYEEQQGNLWHLRYPGANGDVIVATTRPETMLGDTGIAVHPDDERYTNLVGKTVTLPLMNREIPVVADEYVDREFGTGAVKMTPAHDPNDFEVGRRHNLEMIRVINDDGTMSEAAGKYAGMTREECRKAVVADLDALGLLVKIEPLTHNVGTCYRHHTAVEPLVSTQWFVKMQPLADPAIEAVRKGEIEFIPERFSKTYYNWMENIRDWCISRQLWWGHRIPAYYCDKCGKMVVARTAPDACPDCGGSMHQDEDVLDTWFSSALWPFSTLGWPDKTEDLEYFYPTSLMVSGYDIIFFWVARMIFSSIEQMGEVPFPKVLLHGLMRDAQGRKMSKSLGNGIDPLEVIEKYGADALRYSLILGAAPGSDMRMSIEKIEANRNFANKLWNASRFAMMNLEGWNGAPIDVNALDLCDKWILTRFQQTVRTVTENLENLDIGYAAEALYDFVWSQFCDWYIELAKNRLNGEDEAAKTCAQSVLCYVLTGILKLMHPYMPFITEEVYSFLPNTEGMLIKAEWPVALPEFDFTTEAEQMEGIMETIRSIRNLRAEMNVAPGKRAQMFVRPADGWQNVLSQADGYFARLASSSGMTLLAEGDANPAKSASCVTNACAVFIPLGELVDLDKELARLNKDLARVQGEIARGKGMLTNEKFISKAPEALVAQEKEKLAKNEELLTSIAARIAEMQAL
ncbi:MAG: valine--tRNA ligase [Clostridiales bacterium]|nr:valine--tRNA ligase [Clostridiales bacterium]